MSTSCTMPECEKAHWGHGLCKMHYYRWRRQGNPYEKRSPKCRTCLEAVRILNSSAGELEKYADLYLLFKTGSPYRLRSLDEKGREYDLEEGLTYAR